MSLCYLGAVLLSPRGRVNSTLKCILAYAGQEIRLRRPVRDRNYLIDPTSYFSSILFMAGTSCIIVGFSFANEAGCKGLDLLPTYEWRSDWILGKAVSTLLLIIIGFFTLVFGGVYEKYTTREKLFPGAMFTNITSGTVPIAVALKLKLNLWLVSDHPYCHIPSPGDIYVGNVLSCAILSGDVIKSTNHTASD